MRNRFFQKFTKLKIDKNKKIGPAPHKPILLLSVIDLIENGNIKDNKIHITPQLIATYKEQWSLLVDTNHTINFALPFFHLKSDGFWELTPCAGAEIALEASRTIKNLSSLKIIIDYASFDNELFNLLFYFPEKRDDLKAILLNTYFPKTKGNYFNVKGQVDNYIHQIEEDILERTSDDYLSNLDFDNEEDLFVRDGIFKKKIPQIYNFSCAVTGQKIDITEEVQIIDACHIVPWNKSHDDTIANGIALCPNLHRAFDRCLFTIDEDYKFRIYKKFNESNSIYNYHQFEGVKINLPTKKQHWPKPENFEEKLRLYNRVRP